MKINFNDKSNCMNQRQNPSFGLIKVTKDNSNLIRLTIDTFSNKGKDVIELPNISGPVTEVRHSIAEQITKLTAASNERCYERIKDIKALLYSLRKECLVQEFNKPRVAELTDGRQKTYTIEQDVFDNQGDMDLKELIRNGHASSEPDKLDFSFRPHEEVFVEVPQFTAEHVLGIPPESTPGFSPQDKVLVKVPRFTLKNVLGRSQNEGAKI